MRDSKACIALWKSPRKERERERERGDGRRGRGEVRWGVRGREKGAARKQKYFC